MILEVELVRRRHAAAIAEGHRQARLARRILEARPSVRLQKALRSPR